MSTTSGREGAKQSVAKNAQQRLGASPIPGSALRVPQTSGHIIRESVRQSPATHTK